MAKKLIINCGTCDARKVLEEHYLNYESITINAAAILTNPQGKAFFNNLPVILNCSNVLEIENDVDFRPINGSVEIKNSDAVPENKYFMVVNGSLTIGANTQKHLEKCIGMTVNGSITCPESILSSLTNLKLNGSTTCYPDEAILLNHSATIDKLFALRAKNSLYWSARRMIMVDPELDCERLRAKGATFASKEVIIAEGKVEDMVDLIDEKTAIIIVPDGTTVVLDDVTLDENALYRYGKKLYIIGDITVPDENDCLDAIEYLKVQGNAKVPQERKEKLFDVLTEISGEVEIAKPQGTILCNKPYLKITNWMLEQQPIGLDVCDCAIVKIADDVPKDLIAARLKIKSCGVVKCSEEVEDAVSLICQDVGSVSTGDDEDGMNMNDIIKTTLGGIKGILDTKVINASDYVL